MSTILDRLDAEHNGAARHYIATLIAVGGATRAQVAEALANKYSITPPTGRSITQWKNKDSKLRELIDQMQAAKRDLAPGDNPADLLRPPANRAQAVADTAEMLERFPAFADLMQRAAEAARAAKPETTAWGVQTDPDADPEDAAESPWAEVFAALAAGEGMSAEDFDAECRRRLDGWEPPPPEPAPGAGALAD